MAKLNKKEQEIKKLMDIGYSRAEADELYKFDHSDAIESDEKLKSFLKDELTFEFIEEKEIEEMFYKPEAKGKKKFSPTEIKVNTAKAVETNEQRINALAQGLEVYTWLFPAELEIDGLAIGFVDPETSLPVSIKLARHKTQKVVSKEVKRKDPEAPFTTSELRQMAIQNVMLANKELFEAPSFAGSQFGFVARDIKFPFGSIKMTNHKKV